MLFLKQYISTRGSFLLLTGDIILCFLSIYLVSSSAYNLIDLADEYNFFSLDTSIVFIMTIICFSSMSALYVRGKQFEKLNSLLRIVTSNILAFVFLISVIHISSLNFDEHLLWISIITFMIFQYLWHSFHSNVAENIFHSTKKVLIVGSGEQAAMIGASAAKERGRYSLLGYVAAPNENSRIKGLKDLGDFQSLDKIVTNVKPDIIVISPSERRGFIPSKELLSAKLNGTKIMDGPSFYEEASGKLLVEYINPSWMIYSDGFHSGWITYFIKNIMDNILAALGIITTLPIFLMISVLIKCDSPGPILFKQVRIGKNEKPFILYKFRTMVNDEGKNTAYQWAMENDPRITRLGKFLRKSRLDELPQLYNVLQGDLSLVGPRPEQPGFVKELKELIPYYSERHFAKPGLTGWAQVNYPYGASVEDAIEKLRYDLYYMKNFSIWLDIFILLKTVKVVFFGKGAR